MEKTTESVKAKLNEFAKTLTRDNMDEKIDEVEDFILREFGIPEEYREGITVAIVHDDKKATISLALGNQLFSSESISLPPPQQITAPMV